MVRGPWGNAKLSVIGMLTCGRIQVDVDDGVRTGISAGSFGRLKVAWTKRKTSVANTTNSELCPRGRACRVHEVDSMSIKVSVARERGNVGR